MDRVEEVDASDTEFDGTVTDAEFDGSTEPFSPPPSYNQAVGNEVKSINIVLRC